MAKYTLVKLDGNRDIEGILEAINGRRFAQTPEGWPEDQELFASWDPPTGNMGISVVEQTIEFPREYNVTIDGESRTLIIEEEYVIEYNRNFIYTGVDITRPRTEWYAMDGQLLPLDKRINKTQTEVIFFNTEESNFVAIQGSTKSHKVLRTKKDLLEPCQLLTQPNGVRLEDLGLPPEYSFNSDFFYWLYYIYKECNGIIPSQPVPVFLIELSGFHGTALEDTQRTKSQGDRIVELLTTNAFIFADDDIKALRLCVQYGLETIELELHHDGSLDLISYVGEIGDVTLGLGNQDIIIYIYTILLPLLISTYETESSRTVGKWNRTIRDQFLNKIGVDMIAHITEELKKLTPNRTVLTDAEDQSAS